MWWRRRRRPRSESARLETICQPHVRTTASAYGGGVCRRYVGRPCDSRHAPGQDSSHEVITLLRQHASPAIVRTLLCFEARSCGRSSGQACVSRGGQHSAASMIGKQIQVCLSLSGGFGPAGVVTRENWTVTLEVQQAFRVTYDAKETHQTPWGSAQQFSYSTFERQA